mgnify:FL=1
MYSKIIKYSNFTPKISEKVKISKNAWIVGNTSIDDNTTIEEFAVIRGDGEKITIGKNCIIKSNCTVHVASDFLGAQIGDRCFIGKNSVIHACTLSCDVMVGENTIIMDGSLIGNNCIITADALISPGKEFPPFSLISGSPGKVIKKLNIVEFEKIKLGENRKFQNIFLSKNIFRRKEYDIKKKNIKNAKRKKISDKNIFLSPDIILSSKLEMEKLSSIWFSVKILGLNNRCEFNLGEGSNIQDNSIIYTNGKLCKVGKRVTVGHNVIINGPICIEDDAVIGMGSYIESGCVIKKNAFVGANSYVKKNTTVPNEKIFAGNPATFFRDVKKQEKKYFSSGQKIYEKLTMNYKKYFTKT